MSKYFTVEEFPKMRLYANAWFISSKFLAITLFGRIYFRMSESELKEFVKRPENASSIRHEHIHVIQAESFKTRYLGFYLYYIFYWLRNLFKYRFNGMLAYYNIPFEREAYTNQENPDYKQTYWRDYRD